MNNFEAFDRFIKATGRFQRGLHSFEEILNCQVCDNDMTALFNSAADIGLAYLNQDTNTIPDEYFEEFWELVWSIQMKKCFEDYKLYEIEEFYNKWKR